MLLKLAEKAGLRSKIDAMFSGRHINSTEDRAVLHAALRSPRTASINVDGQNVVKDVWEVLDRINIFSEKVRTGAWTGATGKPLRNVVCIGIGGSYLGPLFVHTALATEQKAMAAAEGRTLRFLANVDPIDVANALQGAPEALHRSIWPFVLEFAAGCVGCGLHICWVYKLLFGAIFYRQNVTLYNVTIGMKRA